MQPNEPYTGQFGCICTILMSSNSVKDFTAESRWRRETLAGRKMIIPIITRPRGKLGNQPDSKQSEPLMTFNVNEP